MRSATNVTLYLSDASLVAAIFLALAVLPVAVAKEGAPKFMDAKAVRAVASGKTWQTKKVGGVATGYAWWSWQSDGSVCLRVDEPTGSCFDKGKWNLDGDRLCWQLEWHGSDLGLKSACVRVADQGKGRYLGIDEGGNTLFDFSVAK